MSLLQPPLSSFFEIAQRVRENRLTPEDTLTLLKYPNWINQIAQSNYRYEFLKTFQNTAIISTSTTHCINNIVEGDNK